MLEEDFYKQDTLSLAKALLGTYLVHHSPEGVTTGKIVETEAYLTDDPACHAYHRKTKRNAVMFGKPGLAYVYQIYGLHYCFNVVSAQEGLAEAVLIRALEPTEGIELMKIRRIRTATDKITPSQLCKGPGNLVKAMGISRSMNGDSLLSEKFYINPADKEKIDIITTTRIGITKGVELPYRFYIKDNKCVSYPVKNRQA